jgi:hypothetical protein
MENGFIIDEAFYASESERILDELRSTLRQAMQAKGMPLLPDMHHYLARKA